MHRNVDEATASTPHGTAAPRTAPQRVDGETVHHPHRDGVDATGISGAPPVIPRRDYQRRAKLRGRENDERRATPECRPPLSSEGQPTAIVTIGLHPMLPAASTARERIW